MKLKSKWFCIQSFIEQADELNQLLAPTRQSLDALLTHAPWLIASGRGSEVEERFTELCDDFRSIGEKHFAQLEKKARGRTER